jgi:hypothetical protein
MVGNKKNLSKNNIFGQKSSLKKKSDDFIALTPTYVSDPALRTIAPLTFSLVHIYHPSPPS